MSHTEGGVSYTMSLEYPSYRLTKRSCFSKFSDILMLLTSPKEKKEL